MNLKDILEIDSLEIWKVGDDVCVCFQTYKFIKEPGALIGEYGKGTNFREALENYLKKISGNTLSTGDEDNKKEITLLVIGGQLND